MDFNDYNKLVLDYYKHQVIMNKQFSLNLLYPTTAKLKKECELVYKDRYNKKDERTLYSFFGPYKDAGKCLGLIENCKTDTFKTLWKYVKGKTSEPDIKVIELLAWLIDFQPRPLDTARLYEEREVRIARIGSIETIAINKTEEEERASKFEIKPEFGEKECSSEVGDREVNEEPSLNASNVAFEHEVKIDNSGESNNNESISNYKIGIPVPTIFKDSPESKKKNWKNKKALILFFIIFFLLGGSGIVLSIWKKRNNEGEGMGKLLGPQRCMYWAGEFYKEVDCNTKLRDTVIVAFDSVKFIGLRKITEPDTITQNAIGHIWYVKLKGTIEYYTGEGYHPIYTHLRLKPLTAYMINRHIVVKE